MSHNNKIRITAFLIAFLGVASFVYHRNSVPTDSSKWQAVFLTDGQVYFGKLGNYNSQFVLLDQVYYLKFSQGLQEGNANNISNRELNLIKLGGEAHGPENQMYIAKDKIQFIENLKDTSSVVQAITNHK